MRPRPLAAAGLALASLALATPAAATPAGAELLVLAVEGAPPAGFDTLPADLAEALARGAAMTDAQVNRASTSLTDTAMLVGCEPAEPACGESVLETLDVAYALSARIEATDGGARITVRAMHRGAPTTERTFELRADDRDTVLMAVEGAIPELLGVPVAGPAPVDADATAEVATGIPTGTGGRARPAMPRGPMIVAASGLALVAGGLAMWAVASGTQDDIDGAPTTTPADLERLAGIESDGRTQAMVGNVLVVGGAVALAGGAAWLWWDRRHSSGERAVEVAPLLTPDAAGVVMGGRW